MTAAIPLSAPDITEAEIAAVVAVLRTPHLSFGPELTGFESALATYHSVPHAVAVSSGTAGLQMALITLDIGVGDEVIIPSFTFIAVANAVVLAGATPVFADVDPMSLNLTPATVARVLTSRTRCILAVHTFGIPADMIGLRAVASDHNLALIEDGSEAIGAELHGRIGSFGDLAVFGFYPNKQITTGEGGAVLAQTEAHADRLRALRNQGRSPSTPINITHRPPETRGARTWRDWLHAPEIGFNYRLSDLACALGRVQLSRIDEILSLRRAAAERYHSLLSGIQSLELPPLSLPDCAISWFVYVVRLPEWVNRARIQGFLAERGISTATYFTPIHQQPAWRDLVADAANLPITESIGSRTLALPFFSRIRPDQQQRVAWALSEALASR